MFNFLNKKTFFILSFLQFFITLSAHAVRSEVSFGLGPAFYTGENTSSVSPKFAVSTVFSVNQPLNKVLSSAHRARFDLLISGSQFGANKTRYSGILGAYEWDFRIYFSKKDIKPYVEFGPSLGAFGIYLAAEPGKSTQNQSSIKYGYNIGVGFDWVGTPKGGSEIPGGWGLSASYFSYLKSPSSFEFGAAALQANGVRIEFRKILSEDTGKK